MSRLLAGINVAALFAVTAWAQLPIVQGSNIINTVVGGGNPSGPALAADLGNVHSVVKDGSGNTYLATSLSYVFKLDTLGNLSVYAGTGWQGFGGVGGAASSATLGMPFSLALDTAGDLFIADVGNHVWEVSKSSGKLINVAGNSTFQNPFGGYSGDGGPATQAQLNSPRGVAVGNAVTPFVIADTGNEVIRSISQRIIHTLAGTPGTICTNPTATPACGDGGPALSATFNLPWGVATDTSGNVYIADANDNRIRRVDKNGNITTVAGNGYPCLLENCGDGLLATQANVFHPVGVFVDASGNLYIADQFDGGRIRFVNANTQVISTVAGGPYGGFSGDGGPATSAQLWGPSSAFVDSLGNLLIADTGNNRVREVTSGIINTIAGGGLGGDGGPAVGAVLAQALTLTLDSSGNQFIADTDNCRIRRVDASTHKITTVAGTGNAGYSGDNGPATSADINYPEGVAIDHSGNLFIADSGSSVVRRVDAVTHTITTYAGTVFANCTVPTDPCGDGGPATSATFSVFGSVSVAVDSADNLFISDSGDNRIRCVIGTVGGCGDTQHQYPIGTILTVAGDGNYCFTYPNCGDGGPATSASLFFPFGVALDSSGNLLIVDTSDNVIRRVDAASQIITTVAFNGQPTFGGDGGLALNASMTYPEIAAVDSKGNLFIGGGLDEVVRRIDAATQTVTTVAGNAANPIPYGFKGDGGLATKATLDNFGVAVDSSGNLYVADSGSNRIRAVHLAPKASLSTSSFNFGNQILDTTSNPVAIPFSNAGLDDLQITNITISGDFAQTNTCGNLLAPSLSCNISITFTPRALGIRQGTVTIVDNSSGGTQKITLSGNGIGK